MRDTAPDGDGPEWSRLSDSAPAARPARPYPGSRKVATTLNVTAVSGVPGAVRLSRTTGAAPPADPSPPVTIGADDASRRITAFWVERRYRSVTVPASVPDAQLTEWLSANWSAWYVDEGESDGSEVTGWQADE